MADRQERQPRFEPAGGWTIGEACRRASSFLQTCGVPEPRANAERLLTHVLGLEPAALLRDWNEPLPADRMEEWAVLVRRRAAGEPVQYIIGEQWFCGLPFTVTPAVLIPRPETELLVEAVMAAASMHDDVPSTPTVVDIGTGSGAIAVSLAVLRPSWHICAADLSAEALAVAQANAERHGVSDRILFYQGDLLAPLIAEAVHVDVLVSNPPYIPSADLDGLQREVRDYEPHLALDGGADGLEPYRRIISQLRALPATPRIVAFEVGLGQARAVADMLARTGYWPDIRIIRDYADIERHVVAVSP